MYLVDSISYFVLIFVCFQRGQEMPRIETIKLPNDVQPGYLVTSLGTTSQFLEMNQIIGPPNCCRIPRNSSLKLFDINYRGQVITRELFVDKIGCIISLQMRSQYERSTNKVIKIEVVHGSDVLRFAKHHFDGLIMENSPPFTVVSGLEELYASRGCELQISNRSSQMDLSDDKYCPSHFANETSPVWYSIVEGPTHVFEIFQPDKQQSRAIIKSLKKLDREQESQYTLTVSVSSIGSEEQNVLATTQVWISVLDVNDNHPIIEQDQYLIHLDQDHKAGELLTQVKAYDLDVGDVLRYKFVFDHAKKFLKLNETSGELRLSMDATDIPWQKYETLVFALDSSKKRSKAASVELFKVNHLYTSPKPKIRKTKHSATSHFKEGRKRGITRGRRSPFIRPLRVVDIPESVTAEILSLDKGYFETFSFKESDGDSNVWNPHDLFEMDSLSGILRLRANEKLDYETRRIIDLGIIITRFDDPTFLEEQPIQIRLTDVNDETPEFLNVPRPFLTTVHTNAPPGTSVYQLVAQDADEGSLVRYLLESGGEERFEVDPDTGVVRTRGSQPFPSGKEFEIGVSCQDVTSPTTQKSSTHSLKILVGEREPQFYETQYVASFPETAQVMFKIIEIRALSHQGFPITYELSTESGAQSFEFAIDQSTGVVDLLRSLDYEKDPQQYHLRVKAIENGRPARTSLVNLIVNLVDMNDNVPTFPLSQYIVQGIAETVAVGTDIIQVTATDLDSVTNSQLTYTVSDRSFTVQTLNNIGYVKTARRLDYDRIADHTYNFTIVATDNGTPPLRGSAAVRVSVTNVNDEDPVFVQPLEKVMVSEDAPPSTVVHVVQAYDPDGDDVTYTFSGGRLLEGPFSIDMKSGIITLVGPLDKTKVSYHLNVTAVDNGRCCGGTTTRKSQGQVIIEVKDINNNAPRFPDCSSYNPIVMEKENVGTFVIQVKAVDPDTGSNGNVTYSLIKSNDLSNDKFEIEPRTGVMRTSDVFDREAQLGVTDFGVTVKAEDQGTQTLAGFCTFRVKIGDKNDNPPVFNLPHYTTSIEERSSVGKRIKQVYATDRDAGDNGKVEYFLSNDSSGFFSVNQYNGWVTVARPMSGRELVTIEIEARDKGIPSRSGFVRMDVEITQTTNAYPQWQEDYSLVPARISENAPVNTVVKRLKAFSSIPDSLVNYVIQPGEIPEQNGQPRSFYHRIDETTNEMVLLTYRPLDYEALPQYILTIKAANRATNSLHNDTRLVIDLRDENDEIPQFVGLDENGRYPGSVAENLEPSTEVITVTATDKDQFPDFKKIYYRIKEVGADYDKFSIDRETGVIRSVSSFDREAKNEYYLTVVAEDGAPSDRPNHYPPGTPNMGEAEVQIRVTDMNDNSPFFRDNLYTTRVPENTDPGTVIITVTAEDRDEENRLTYSIVGGNTGNAFEVVADLGEIKVRGHLDYEDGPREYMLTYRVFDDKFTNTTHVRVQVLDVNDNPPLFDNNIYNVTDIMEEEPGISKNNPKYLLSVRATDPDIDRNSVVKYSLTGQFADDGTFFVNEHTGEIYLTKSLDRDHGRGRPVWNFNVLAHDEPDSHQPSLTGYAEVRVMPRDINDNAPVFDRNRLVGRILEHSRAGMTVLTVIATDADNGNNGSVGYTLKQVPMRGNQPLFSIDSHMGLISTMINNALDREVQAEYQVLVQARDKGIPPMIASATVTIIIDDINDHRPRFNHPLYRATIPEDAAVGSSVISVSATDKDVGHNAKLTYTLSEMDREHFYIMTVEATNTGVLKVFKPIDFDSLLNPLFNVTVYVQDTDPGHTDVTSVEVKVTDANDNPPVFVPNSKKVTIFENVTIGTTLHRFSASDKDTGINKQFRYSIDRHTDVDRKFSIDSNGLVTTSKLLDREIVQGHRIHILAIDRGNPPQTGTGTLMVHLNDVNDNPPEFASSYRPVVYENRPPGQTVVVISAVDRDTASNGPPFEMWLPCGGVCPCHSNPTCADFEFRFLPDGGENNFGAGLVRTLRTFDREARKEFRIPIILKDSGHPPISGTSTLTVVIGDINDNQHYPGHKDVLVYNYVGWKGEFETLPFGNVYAEDEDDWDVSNKTFHLLSHRYDEDLFGLERHTGHLYSKGRLRASEYHLRVKVHDMIWKKEVTSTVTVRVKEITDDALNNLGSFRMEGITAEEFIGREKISPSASEYGQSKMDLFARLMTKKLGPKYHPSNIEVISLMNTPSFNHVVDVRFAVHASPYLKPSKLNGILNIHREEFEELLGGRLLMSPIDECLEEKQCYGNRKGCRTKVLTSDSDPLIVNTNSSSLVGVVVTSYAECICKGNDFLGEKGFECQPGSCLNGGTCVQTSSSIECLCSVGFKGPRCQQTHLSFNGDGYAWFPALDQCDESHTSFEFITLKESGLMLFYGSLMEQRPDSNEDFVLLELRGGYPYMRINLGSGEVKLSLDGKDKQGVKRMDKLNDGKWHRIDIIISTRTVQLVVNRCENGVTMQESDSDSSPSEDRRSCESVNETPGEGRRLNVNSLLSLGGRHQDPHRSTFPPNVMKEGFDGCIKNFMHNSELYDLNVGKTGGGLNAEDFCSREDKICYNKRYEDGKRREKEQKNATLLKLASCGEEGTCVAGLVSPSGTYPIQMCLCNPGWRGTFCNIETTILDFGTKSFLEWDFKDDFYSYLDKREGYKSDVKLMFRTRRNSGLLFKAQNAQKSEYILLEIHQSRLRFRFNLGHREISLVLSRINISDGIWHSVSVERRGRWVEIRADKGEGLHYNSTLGFPDESRVEIKLSQRSILSGGDVRFPSSDSPPLVDHDFEDGCMNDIRYNEAWLPMSVLENHESEAAEFMVRSQNVVPGCPSDACDHYNCGLMLVCVDLWRKVECRCPVGSRPVNLEVMHSLIFNPSHEQLACEPINECLEANPCHFGECQDTPEGFYCLCSSGYSGLYCAEKGSSLSSSVTMAPEGLLAIVISLVVIAVLIIVIIIASRKRPDDSYTNGVDPHDDVRENIIHYDEEGIGEEDQLKYDINKLKKPVSCGKKLVLNGLRVAPVEVRAHKDKNIKQAKLNNKSPAPLPLSSPNNTAKAIKQKLWQVDHDTTAPPYDTVREYAFEGSGSFAGSLSSLASNCEEEFDPSENHGCRDQLDLTRQEWSRLSAQRPGFKKLADLYGFELRKP